MTDGAMTEGMGCHCERSEAILPQRLPQRLRRLAMRGYGYSAARRTGSCTSIARSRPDVIAISAKGNGSKLPALGPAGNALPSFHSTASGLMPQIIAARFFQLSEVPGWVEPW
jgi:hypothetical protein